MEYLDEIINLRIKPSDKEKLIDKANEDNLSVSAYCRVKLTKELNFKKSLDEIIFQEKLNINLDKNLFLEKCNPKYTNTIRLQQRKNNARKENSIGL